MATKATEHIFNGDTAPLTFFSYGTVSVSTTAVTGTKTFFNASMVGMKIGFGANYISGITTWYTISSYTSRTSITLLTSAGTINAGSSYVISGYDSTKTNLGFLMTQKSGQNPADNYAGPFPIAMARPYEESTPVALMFPHVITVSDTIDWVFLTENATGATATRKVVLYEFNKVTFTYNWKGFITATFPQASTTTRGFRALRYLHTTGTVSVATPAMVFNTGTVTAVIAGTVTHSATGFLPAHIGLMMGFGSNDPTQINCWYPIISNTSTSVLVVSGITSAFAGGTSFVIASCVVTGSATKNFIEEGLAAGASQISAAGLTAGLGPRIGFGSTDPNLITQWYQIGRITGETTLNLVTSPGIIASGTPYVIEELRFAFTLTHGTATNGGLFLLKGVGYLDFTTAGNTFPTIVANATDSERGVYWLSDAGTTAGTNIVTNTSPCGLTVVPEINKGLHYAYVIDGTGSTFVKIFRYNLRATGTITAGKMLMSVAYTTTGTVTVSAGTTVTSDASTPFTVSMVGMKIGFGSKSPAMITTWYTVVGYTSSSVITINANPGSVSTSLYVIDSADVIATSGQVVTGTINVINNGRIGTLDHGVGKNIECLYFVTTTRIYRTRLSKIYAGNIEWIEDNRPEIPPGSVNTYAATGALSSIEILDTIDKLLVLSTAATSTKHYITQYPTAAGDQFDRVFGVDTKQFDQSTADQNIPMHFNTNSTVASAWGENGFVHIIKHGGTVTTISQLYALPLCAHWSYTSITDQRIITPSISTPNCLSFKRMMSSNVDHLGNEEFRLPTGSIISYFRTNGITDNSGDWTHIPDDGDLSGLAPSSAIQFMFEFTTISLLGITGRLMSVAVLYDDYSTDPHYQPSVGKTVLASKQFAWRFSTAFGTTVPTLRIRLFDAVTGGLLLDDKTTSPTGTWEKTIDNGATNWTNYNTSDKTNEITYIRYTPTTLPDNNKVRALLTLY